MVSSHIVHGYAALVWEVHFAFELEVRLQAQAHNIFLVWRRTGLFRRNRLVAIDWLELTTYVDLVLGWSHLSNIARFKV